MHDLVFPMKVHRPCAAAFPVGKAAFFGLQQGFSLNWRELCLTVRNGRNEMLASGVS